jgi:hypothetical protein
MMSFGGRADWLGQNGITWGQANSTNVPPDQKSKQSYLSMDIGTTYVMPKTKQSSFINLVN